MWVFEDIIRDEDPLLLSEYLENKSETVSSLRTKYLVKINESIINRKDFNGTRLKPNDRILILPLLGGG